MILISIYIQLISYKRYLECTLVQWRLNLSLRAQVAVGTFLMKSPVCTIYPWGPLPFYESFVPVSILLILYFNFISDPFCIIWSPLSYTPQSYLTTPNPYLRTSIYNHLSWSFNSGQISFISSWSLRLLLCIFYTIYIAPTRVQLEPSRSAVTIFT